jgi:hypothetical protein
VRTFATPEPVVATVQAAGAEVRLTAGDRTDTTVLVEPIDPASPSDVEVAGRTRVAFTAGRVSVRTTVRGDKDGASVAVTIALPTGSGLVAYLAHASVEAGGALGECELHVAKGSVRLDRVDTLQANIATGDVAVCHVAGHADIQGSAAALRIGEVPGAVGRRSGAVVGDAAVGDCVVGDGVVEVGTGEAVVGGGGVGGRSGEAVIQGSAAVRSGTAVIPRAA